MRQVTITFAESALRDLEEILGWYYGLDVPDVGAGLVEEVFRRVEALAKYPDMGRVVPEFDQPHLRELIHPPFRIVYRRDTELVRVVRVWRSERLLGLAENDR